MRISYLSDSTLFSGTANIIHVIKMSQALALQGHSVILHVRSESSYSDLLCDISDEYGIRPLFKVRAWRIGRFKGSCYVYGFFRLPATSLVLSFPVYPQACSSNLRT